MPLLSQFFFHSHQVFPRKLQVLFVAKLLHASGNVLTTFFLAIFLFKIGEQVSFPLISTLSTFQKGMIVLGGFFFLERLVMLFTNKPMSKLIVSIGYRNGMIVGQLFNLVYLLTLQFVESYPLVLFVSLVIEAIKIPIFWNSYYSLFAKNAVYKNMGKSVGTIEFFTKLLQVGLPALLGFMVANFGFSYVFLIGLGLQFVSMLTLLLVENVKQSPGSLDTQLQIFEKANLKKFKLAIAGRYFVDSLHFLWPFFVFLLIGSVEEVGFIYSFVFFLSLLLTYFTGWYVDHQKSRKPFIMSGLLLAGLWVGRTVVASVWGIIFLDTIDRLASSIFNPFYDSLMYKGAKERYTLAYFVYREQQMCKAAVLFWTLFLGYFLLSAHWQGFLLLGLLGMTLSVRLSDHIFPSKEIPELVE